MGRDQSHLESEYSASALAYVDYLAANASSHLSGQSAGDNHEVESEAGLDEHIAGDFAGLDISQCFSQFPVMEPLKNQIVESFEGVGQRFHEGLAKHQEMNYLHYDQTCESQRV